MRLPENGSTYKEIVEEYERRLDPHGAAPHRRRAEARRGASASMKPTTLHEIIKRLEIQSRGT